jgi:predicted DsbA family dithiol-disulfide isomerase
MFMYTPLAIRSCDQGAAFEYATATEALAARNGRDAEEAGLPLPWLARLPNALRALEAAEAARQHQQAAFRQVAKGFFAAPFALGEDLEDFVVIDRHTAESGVRLGAMHAAC